MGKKALITIFSLALILIFGVRVFAEGEGKVKLSLNASVGMVTYTYKDATTGEEKTENLARIIAHPEIGAGPFSLGLDINYLIADKEKKEKLGETGKNPVILKYVQYEKDPYFARWGVLRGVELNPLIMSNYTTEAIQESAVFTNKDKAALIAYKGITGGSLLGTQTHVYGGRLYHKFNEIREGLTVGVTYAVDGDEEDDITAYGVDVKVPLIGKLDLVLANAWVEYPTSATQKAKGSGFSAGIAIGSEKIGWKNEYRSFNKEFIPTVFDAHYEANSLSRKQSGGYLAPATNKKNGFLSKLTLTLGEQLSMWAAYEDYEDVEPRLIAEAKFKLPAEAGGFKDLTGKVTYEQQNFRLKDEPKNTIIKGEATTSLNKFTELVITYTKVYEVDAAGNLKPVKSYNYGIRLKI